MVPVPEKGGFRSDTLQYSHTSLSGSKLFTVRFFFRHRQQLWCSRHLLHPRGEWPNPLPWTGGLRLNLSYASASIPLRCVYVKSCLGGRWRGWTEFDHVLCYPPSPVVGLPIGCVKFFFGGIREWESGMVKKTRWPQRPPEKWVRKHTECCLFLGGSAPATITTERPTGLHVFVGPIRARMDQGATRSVATACPNQGMFCLNVCPAVVVVVGGGLIYTSSRFCVLPSQMGMVCARPFPSVPCCRNVDMNARHLNVVATVKTLTEID